MPFHQTFRSSWQRRAGKTLVMFAILLPVLLGMVGLAIDTGLLMAAQRQAQNGADAAALAAAMKLMFGNSEDVAVAEANTFLKQQKGMSSAATLVRDGGAQDALNMPPIQGPHTGSIRYVEAIVSCPVNTLFVQALNVLPGVSVNQTQTVRARAVAGYEAIAAGEGAIVLDPKARPGLTVTGGATLRVNGAVIVNSRSAGLDQYGDWVNWGQSQYALTSSNNSTIEAQYIQVKGGVDVVNNYHNIDPSGPNPLFCRAPIAPDPLRELPIPTQTNVTSISDWTRIPAITVNSGQSRTFNPGVYEDISILQGTTVVFNPGVYILSPTKPNQGLRTNGSTNITGNGVMFYATGSNYLDVSPGYWDSADGILDGPLPPNNGPDTLPPPPDPNFNKVKFATVDINATNSHIVLNGLNDSNSPFDDVLFFQRRRNTSDVSIQGNAGVDVDLGGTMYAKWARFKLAGGGRYDAQFVVGSMEIAGQAPVVILSSGKSLGIANQVFLVE